MMANLLCSILILAGLFFLIFTQSNHLHVVNAAGIDVHAPTTTGSIRVSVGNLYNISVGSPSPIRLNTVIVALIGDGFFFPILSSPSFNTSTTGTSSQSLGFSFGFFVSYANTSATGITYSIYLAVCAGRSGNYLSRHQLVQALPWMQGANDSKVPYKLADGYVVPIRIFNLHHPLLSVNSFNFSSLLLEDGSSELKFRSYDGSIAWKVSNISAMEMQDAGILVMYDSVFKSKVAWLSNTEASDTLLQGQRLKPGMKLKSNDSSYTAQMEEGGLVLYSDKASFVEDPSPYWVFPVLFQNVGTFANLKEMVLSAPCSDRSDPAYAMLGNSTWDLFLQPGSCDPDYSMIITVNDTSESTSWSFIRLENDGRLYIYGVINPATRAGRPSLKQYALDSKWAVYSTASPDPFTREGSVSTSMPFFAWGKCDVPMACGPLGLCTPDATKPCTCPHESLHPINSLDPSQGCQYQPTSNVLPPCQFSNSELMINTTQYLRLNATASIFLFSGWTFAGASTSNIPLEACQRSCTLNCSCTGFFYQANSLSCFFISDKLSLLRVTSRRLNQVSNVPQTFAEDYVTYLRVASSQPAGGSINATYSGSNATSGTKESSGSKETFDNQGNQATNVFFAVAVSVVPAVAACLVAGLAVYWARKRRLRKMSEQLNEEDLKDILPLLPTRFSYKDLRDATGGFSKLLGSGACGSVYAGLLSDGRKVAVKMLAFLSKGQSKQFLAEVATMGRTNHVNIVRLVGFCWEVSHRLLVYEYVERGSLNHWLFSDADTLSENGVNDGAIIETPLLDWQTRYNLALGIARGLSYLHEDCTQPILHFDIKPQNILLDNAFVAKIADFGMSKLMQRGISKVVTGVRGTPGYIAPEWLSGGPVSKKSDVYSMGMVMLEIVGGRRNLDIARQNNTPDLAQQDAWHFPSWAAEKCKQGLMMEIVDKRLQVCGFDEEQVRTLIYTTFWCIQDDPELRPHAPTVVQWLEGKSPVGQPPFSPAQSLSNAKSHSPHLMSI